MMRLLLHSWRRGLQPRTLAPPASPPTLSPATRGGRCQGRADPERFLLGRIEHLGFPCHYRAQNFLLFRLGHFEVVERTADLRSNLVELFRSDMEVLVGFAELPACVVTAPPGRCADPE